MYRCAALAHPICFTQKKMRKNWSGEEEVKLFPVIRSAPEAPVHDDRLLWDIWLSVFHFPLLIAADEIGLFAFLGPSPATAVAVASRLDLSLRSAEAMLGTLTALGCLVQHQGQFYLTHLTRTYLLPDSPYYFGGMLQAYRSFPSPPS